MKRNWLRSAAAFLLAVLLVPRLRANEVLVTFEAIVEQSPFTVPGLDIGSEITGGYFYDPATLPYSFDFSYSTKYDVSRTFLTLVDYGYSGGYNGYVHVSSRGSWDRYRVNGGLGTPALTPDGFRASFWALNMEGYNSYYAAKQVPYPIDLPDLASFGPPTLLLAFDNSSAMVYAVARVTNVEKTVLDLSTHVPDSGSGLVLLTTSFGVMALIRARLKDCNHLLLQS